jgi:hypothetical protein
MKKLIMSMIIVCVFGVDFAVASGRKDVEGHNMTASKKIGDLIHESMVDGYMLSYHFMDLRDQKTDGLDKAIMDRTSAMTDKQIDKPHHLMVYIMDENHKPVFKGKVGFLFKDPEGNSQKMMGMYMSGGFGTTADMKKKGVYTITTKAMLGDKKIMDRFDYEIK